MVQKFQNRLLDSCKEALADIALKSSVDFLSVFKQKEAQAQDAGDEELAEFMKLLRGVFSMYFQFKKDQPFGSLMSGPQGRTMIPEDLTDDELLKLEELLTASINPQFIARICDVLWIRRKNYLYAQKAVKAYLQSVDEDKDECWVPKSEWLKRSTQIAISLGEKAPERQVIKQKLFDLFEDGRKKCFDAKQDYWPASLLELLIENKLADDWEKLGDESVEIAKGFPVSPGCDAPRRYYELASKCYTYAKKPDKANKARIDKAKHFEDEARSFNTPQGCDGFNMAHHLEKAIQTYREAGEKAKAEELIHELKEANKIAVSQMKPIKAEIDATPLIKLADDSLQGKNGLDAINGFISLYQPCSYEKERISVEELAKKYPLQAILGKSIFTSESNISAKIPGMLEDNTDNTQAAIIQQYNLSQNLVAATTLRRAIVIILKSDETWKTAVKEIITMSKFVPEERRDIFEKAITAGFEGDLLVFTHLIIPQIENSIRVIFALNKLKVTAVSPEGTQEERDLNSLLTDANAEGILGRDLAWEMRSLLIEKSGPNLRNRLCHGLMSSENLYSTSAVFLLWLTLYLVVDFQIKDGK